ncbi:thiol-disulfide oxidoreductase DCC family protein [Roseibium sp. MMSF_3412]|uniref:thiol-disulfide oxidoreductase DCC family protein n=1 Tax=Roseibium sp. MMSF_3412 TaxID=3046712 RepID=UPI00273ED144|nr:DUF393 domain-containing protein [Roseibium sp. MMSF_3412]
MIEVYYDGKCGLCSREIGYYKRLTPKTSIVWNDIATHPELLQGTGMSQSDALLYLRVRDDDGAIQTGLDAFLVIWRQFRGWRLLAMLATLPGIYRGVAFAYRKFADQRFNRHAHCQASLQPSAAPARSST